MKKIYISPKLFTFVEIVSIEKILMTQSFLSLILFFVNLYYPSTPLQPSCIPLDFMTHVTSEFEFELGNLLSTEVIH